MAAEVAGFVCPDCIKALPSYDALLDHVNKGKCGVKPGQEERKTLFSRVARRFQRHEQSTEKNDDACMHATQRRQQHMDMNLSFPPQEIGLHLGVVALH